MHRGMLFNTEYLRSNPPVPLFIIDQDHPQSSPYNQTPPNYARLPETISHGFHPSQICDLTYKKSTIVEHAGKVSWPVYNYSPTGYQSKKPYQLSLSPADVILPSVQLLSVQLPPAQFQSVHNPSILEQMQLLSAPITPIQLPPILQDPVRIQMSNHKQIYSFPSSKWVEGNIQRNLSVENSMVSMQVHD